MLISPKYQMRLIDQVERAIWKQFESYRNVMNYIKKWHEYYDFGDQNFIIHQDENNINLNETLHGIDSETIMKIAIDLGIETPDFIPSIPIFKNVLKTSYIKPFDSFEKSLKQIEEDPDLAIGLANSTLESIIKHILENDNIQTKLNEKDTLYELTSAILKEFSLFPNADFPIEIKTIGSGLLKVSQSIEGLRSEKTKFHGKTKEAYIVNDSIYAYFVINAVSTVGQFLIQFYEKKYISAVNKKVDDLLINPDTKDIPF